VIGGKDSIILKESQSLYQGDLGIENTALSPQRIFVKILSEYQYWNLLSHQSLKADIERGGQA